MSFLNIFKHLLPRARAWRITIDKQLRQFFDGLSGIGSDVKDFLDGVWTDIDPQETRELDAWETQFALPDSSLTEQERRDRLEATWQATGGQSPRYIQDTLQDAGFDVYVHDWWVPGSEPAVNVKQCVTPRDPTALLIPPNYPLVNKIFESRRITIVQAGEAIAQAGEPLALAGNFLSYTEQRKIYEVPTDPDKWPYFMYIGGEVFGTFANVDTNRYSEFEDLCLKICPCQLWIGLFITEV